MEVDNSFGVGEEIDIEILQLPLGQELIDSSGHVCSLPEVVGELEVFIARDKVFTKLLVRDSLEGGLYPEKPPGLGPFRTPRPLILLS